MLLLEIIVQSVEDARAAAEGGADRLEVVRAIREGGLTPSPSLIDEIRQATPLPLRVMVRGNSGYDSTPDELRRLQRAAGEFAAAGVDGLVAGFAQNGALALDELLAVIAAAPGVPVTFHRAFDALTEPERAIDVLAEIPAIDRILTSGEGTALERSARLHNYSARAGSRLTIIAGGGVDEEAIAVFARARCVREIHVGRLAREGFDPEGPVSAARVRRIRDLADA